MKIVVIGAGVIGVTSAWYLARDGHQVTVLERRTGPGLETSFANGGQISTSHAMPWSSPAVPGQLLRWFGRPRAPLKLRLRGDREQFAWCLRFLRECLPARARRNTLIKLRLCQYSQRVMNELVRVEGIDYHAVARGALYLYRDPALLGAGIKKMALLAEHGQKQEILDPAGVAKLDPVFEPVRGKIAGAIRDLGDSSGDSRLFTERLGAFCRDRLGVTVKLGARVIALRTGGDRIDAVVTGDGALTADSYVLALGVGSAGVARTAGVSLPIYPAKGYSSTFPLRPGGLAPTIPGVDEQWLVGWSRLGDRLRLTSTAEFAGYDWGWTPRDFNNILRFARDVFPDAVDFDRGEYRACLRPMTPDGPPILGLGRYRNLFFNCGHGHMGWTMACGTARIVADLMSGRMPELDLDGLTPRR